ncbi:glycosyltransferase family 2 protein [Saccharothrix australiensis]|uniref:GT2 family glycosyltransferase n=1 Tax=Saccharothrix australiensis TaxID=2072 RepID=A0A495VX97_9PSEU|nr:glycosyltransferase [Saccharothrix australiensis]RKT54051.1 GT2 family glycosyltransferase [Saccharothrix australiensis]
MADTTVVIATRDRVEELTRTLTRLAVLDVPVIVVDNGSSDDTVERVRRDFPHVEVLPLGRNEGALARNAGVRRARTPYVAFSDDDSWWAPDALRRAEALFDRHPRLGLVAARTVVEPEGRDDPMCAVMADSALGTPPDLPGPAVLGFMCCGAIVRRAAFLRVGGFHPVLFFRGEERLFSWDLAAAGWACAYVADVVAHHQPSRSRPPGTAGRRRELRNDLLTTWLRRPLAVAWGGAVELARRGLTDRVARAALGEAVARLPAVAWHRRRLPADVERQIALLG